MLIHYRSMLYYIYSPRHSLIKNIKSIRHEYFLVQFRRYCVHSSFIFCLQIIARARTITYVFDVSYRSSRVPTFVVYNSFYGDGVGYFKICVALVKVKFCSQNFDFYTYARKRLQ